jgi:hypothetical protein
MGPPAVTAIAVARMRPGLLLRRPAVVSPAHSLPPQLPRLRLAVRVNRAGVSS